MSFVIKNDKPINRMDQDKLNRTKFVEQLASSLYNLAQSGENLVIGIEGEWGSGKTSILNMLQEKIALISKVDKRKTNVAVLNSWLCSDRDSLIMEFFKEIKESILKDGRRPLDKKDLAHLASCLVKGSAKALSVSNTGISLNFETFFGEFDKDTVKQKKEIVVSKLKTDGVIPLIYFIDDIDRLTEDEILVLFQLVKNIADFPKVIYVLSYDRNIVTKALDKAHSGKGNDYLEKIVQVPFKIPAVRKHTIREYFRKELKNIISEYQDALFDNEHCNEMVDLVTDGYIHTMRSCKRVLNSFLIAYNISSTNFDIGDLLGITVVNLYEHDAYEIIRHHKNELCVAFDIFGTRIYSEQANILYNEIMMNVKGDKSTFKALLQCLFPEFIIVVESKNNQRDNARFANRDISRINWVENFDNYFCLDIDSDTVPIAVVLNFLTSKEIPYSLLKNVIVDGLFYDLLNKVGTLVDTWWKDEFRQKVSDLNCINVMSSLSTDVPVEHYSKSMFNRIDSCIWNIIRYRLSCIAKNYNKEDYDEDFKESSAYRTDLMNLFSSIFKNNDINIFRLTTLLYNLSAGYPWLYENERHLNATNYLKEFEFVELRKLYAKRLEDASLKDDFLDNPLLMEVLRAWNIEDYDGYYQFMRKDESGVNLARKIAAFVDSSVINGDEKQRYWLIYDHILRDSSFDEIPYDKIETSVKSDEFRSLPLHIQQEICALLLSKGRLPKEKEYLKISKAEIDKKLKELLET